LVLLDIELFVVTVYNQLLFYSCLGLLFYWAKICSIDVTSYTFVNADLLFYFYGAQSACAHC